MRSASRDPLRVLVVDDSAVVREAMGALLSHDQGLAVVTAPDPLIAMSKMQARRPDVILLDLDMPRMDGLTFLRKLMAEDPIPVVVCSGFAERGTEAAFRALEAGALDVVAKPKFGVQEQLQESVPRLIDTLRGAAQARLRSRSPMVCQASDGVAVEGRFRAPSPARLGRTSDTVVAIGASTGGTEALRAILAAMPRDAPGLVIVQHMPEGFTAAFAQRLNAVCRIAVKEAARGDRVREGRALIAPGNRHLVLVRSGAHYTVEVTDGPPVSRHRPSVDVLFRSVAQAAGRNAVGIILTGMGDDGAAGLLEMKRAGAATLAQDEATCVVFGMPKEARRRGAVDAMVPLHRIPTAALQEARGTGSGAA